MTTPDNARLLASERAAFESEAAFAREEQALWQKLEAALSDDSDRRAESLTSRLSMLATAADAPAPLLEQAQTLAAKRRPAHGVPGGSERQAALAARQTALQSRQLALQAMARGVDEMESARAARARELDELDSLLQRIETEAKQAEAARVMAEKSAREAAARKKEQEEAALQARLAEEKAQASTTSPSVPVFDPGTTTPSMPAFPSSDEAETVAEMPVLAAPKPAETAAVAAAPAPARTAPAQAPAAARKRTSRRRRVRLAPPPRKLHVEVAEHGEDTFYTGWEESIADGGLFVVSLETLPPGHELDVEVQVGGKTIKSRGQVQFVRKDNIANPDCMSGAGIKLLNLTADNTSTIESFFSKRAPMFFVQR